MPFTPYHLGSAFFIGLLLSVIFDLPSLLISSVLVDIEPFLVLSLDLDYPLHGYVHSFIGGSIIAILTSIIVYTSKNKLRKTMQSLGLVQNSSFKKIIGTSFSAFIFIFYLIHLCTGISDLFTHSKPTHFMVRFLHNRFINFVY